MKSAIPDALRNSRLKAGIKQQDVERLAGMAPRSLSHFESGRKPLPRKYLTLLPGPIQSAVRTAMTADLLDQIQQLRDPSS